MATGQKAQPWEDRYELCEDLGEGGNASVFHVREKSTGKEFALKQLVQKSTEKKARFISEIKIVKEYVDKIDGILPIYEYSEDDFWYVMPIATPVMDHISRSKLTVDGIINAVIQMADTLAKLHEEGISHRDIKPSNIYYYNGKYCLADFGLVDFPENPDDFTRSDKGLGAIFTIAPEMKRDPKHADGKKADVFSLAKTTWMLLSGDELGFDGVYELLDKSHSLRFIEKYKETHLLELEELLTASTHNDPLTRPTMLEYIHGLKLWLGIFKDQTKSQESDWAFLKKYLLGPNAPETACWSNLDGIVTALNIIASVPAYNHLLLPDGGGTDLVSAELAPEEGCIYLHDNLMTTTLVKPYRLYFTSYENDIAWNYFFLELKEVEPIFGKNEFASEYLVEDIPGHYVSARYAQYGVYDYDSGKLLPEGHKIVRRYYKGNILIVFKQGPYNGISSTYDGRQSLVDYRRFSKYMENLTHVYDELVKQGYEPNAIINAPAFGRNPFVTRQEEDEQHIIEKLRKTEKFITEDYSTWDFYGLLGRTELCGNAVFYIEFVPEKNDIFDLLSHEKYVLCSDGRIKSITSTDIVQNAYLTSSRDEIYKLMNACYEHMQKQSGVEDGDSSIWRAHFSIEILKTGNPKHLFTQDEIGVAMRQADDRVHNVLVIDEDGYAHVISDIYRASSYPVRHETWDAGNCYVGKYSTLRTLDDMYVQSLEGWYDYLTHGHSVHKDYIDGVLSRDELIQKIHEMTDFAQ